MKAVGWKERHGQERKANRGSSTSDDQNGVTDCQQRSVGKAEMSSRKTAEAVITGRAEKSNCERDGDPPRDTTTDTPEQRLSSSPQRGQGKTAERHDCDDQR